MGRTAVVTLAVLLLTLTPRRASANPCGELADQLAQSGFQSNHRRIAIVPFTSIDGKPTLGGHVVSRRIAGALAANRSVEVVSQKDANALVTGTALMLEDGKVEVQARLVDARTGKDLQVATAQMRRDWSETQPVEFEAVEMLHVPAPVLDPLPQEPMADKSHCDRAKDKVQMLGDSIVELRARYWASRLRDPNYSMGLIQRNPGSEIEDIEARDRFYRQLELWYWNPYAARLNRDEQLRLEGTLLLMAQLSHTCDQ